MPAIEAAMPSAVASSSAVNFMRWPAAATAPSSLPAGLAFVTAIEGVHEYRLANGLQILLLPDQAKPNITINVTYRVGSRHESYGETGMAHLLEHMLFKGTPTHTDVPKLLKDRGAQFNGTTWLDRTNYFATVPAEWVELVLWMEADRLGTLLAALDHALIVSRLRAAGAVR